MNQSEKDFQNSEIYKQAFEKWQQSQQPKVPKQYTSTSGKPIFEGQLLVDKLSNNCYRVFTTK